MTEAGWYPDPENPSAQRWWDGETWGPPGAAPPATPPVGQYPPVPQPPYPPMYQNVARPTTAGKATAILVLGILSIPLSCTYGFGIVTAIIALALTPSTKREIAASNGTLDGLGQIKAGVICAWVAIGLTALVIIGFIALMILGSSLPAEVYTPAP